MQLVRRWAGLSLIEVVVAMFILFLASSFLMSMFITGSQAVAKAEEVTHLNALAQSKMDEIMGTRYDLLSAMQLQGSFSAPDDGYSYSIALNSYSGNANMSTVSLSVSSPSGKTRNWTALRAADPRPPGEALYNGYGCVGCHTLQQVGAYGKIGPSHTHLGDVAAYRDPRTPTAHDYIEKSVRDPQYYVVPGYHPFMAGLPLDSMPQKDLDNLTNWLVNTTTAPPPPPPPPDASPGSSPTEHPQPSPPYAPPMCISAPPWSICHAPDPTLGAGQDGY